jgi:hypothetical protein
MGGRSFGGDAFAAGGLWDRPLAHYSVQLGTGFKVSEDFMKKHAVASGFELQSESSGSPWP